MYFILNDSVFFHPDTFKLGLSGQHELSVTLSAPAARLLIRLIDDCGEDLARDELIKTVWEAHGYAPSGNNLNKAISEIRRELDALGIPRHLIVTIPRYGFRLDAHVKRFDGVPPMETAAFSSAPVLVEPAQSSDGYCRWMIFLIIIFVVSSAYYIFFMNKIQRFPVRAKVVAAQNIGQCRLWLVKNDEPPRDRLQFEKFLASHRIYCDRRKYDIYFFESRFSISEANETFIGACSNDNAICKTVRYKRGEKE